MDIIAIPQTCRADECLPLISMQYRRPANRFHILAAAAMPTLPVGSCFYAPATSPDAAFRVCGHVWLPGQPAARAPLLMACHDVYGGQETEYTVRKRGYALAAITLSDKGAAGQREDKSGPLLATLVGGAVKLVFSQNFILPDDRNLLRGLLAELALIQGYDLICTCGGTGVGPRDITPQATEAMLDIAMPGIAQAMLMASLAKTPRAVISRAAAGLIGKCLVINLPGSPKAVRECLEPLLPALEHTLAKIHGDTTDCGG